MYFLVGDEGEMRAGVDLVIYACNKKEFSNRKVRHNTMSEQPAYES